MKGGVTQDNGDSKPVGSCAGTGGRALLPFCSRGELRMQYRSHGGEVARKPWPHLVQDVNSCVRRMVTQSRDHPVIELLFPYLHQ